MENLDKLSEIEKMLSETWNPTAYITVKQYDYIIDKVGSYYCMRNGTGNTAIQYRSTNFTKTFNFAVGNGSSVYIKNGYYPVTGLFLELDNNSLVVGESMINTVIYNSRTGSNSIGGIFETANMGSGSRAYNITLSNFCVDGLYPAATSQSFGIYFENADYVSLDRLKIINVWHDAIAFNTITTARGHGAVTGSKTSNHVSVTNCEGYNIGVDFLAFGTYGGSDVTIDNIKCEKWGQNGTTGGRVITFCNWTDGIVSNVYGNSSVFGDGIVCWLAYNIEFENIIIRDAGSNGIRLSPSGTTRCENLQFSNVFIWSCGENGFYLGMAENCSFTNVQIEDCTWSGFNVSSGQWNQYNNLRLVHNSQYGFWSGANYQYINGVYWSLNTLGEWVLPNTCLIFNSAGNMTQNWGFAADKVSGGTIAHGLGVAPTTVLANAETTGVICSTRTLGATTFVIGLSWYNGTAVDSTHTPQDCSWYAIYQP
jgi:hypothetical protein